MGTTRLFNSLGVVASDAQEVTEDGPRTIGEYYRRTNLSDSQQVEGEEFDINPRTEFLNQKINNQSKFTDLINVHGYPGWTDLVTYEPPALVWGFDGTPGTGDYYICIQANGPNSPNGFIVDPADNTVNSKLFWVILESSQQLRLDLTDETPGSEGSTLVGHNYIDVNGGTDEGLTVKTALDNAFLAILSLQGIELLSFGTLFTASDTQAPPVIFETAANELFNMAVSGISVIPGLDGVGDPTSATQGLKLTYPNPLPASYNVQVYALIGDRAFVTQQYGIGSYISYRNLLTTSLDIYYRYYPNQPQSSFIQTFIAFSFVCYRYNP